MGAYYTYLVSGLPELGFDMNLDGFSYEELSAQIFESLSEGDARVVRFFLAFPEHKALVERYLALEKGEAGEDARREYVASHADMPDYQRRFWETSLSVLVNGEEDLAVEMQGEALEAFLKNILDKEFYSAARKSRNAFMRQWYDFDLVLRNTLVAFAARLQGRAPQDEFVYPGYDNFGGRVPEEDHEPELITWIKENFKQEDFGLRLRLSYAEDLFAALALSDVYERERRVDRFRWNMAEEMVRGKEFELDAVLAYFVKAGILQRWKALDRERGLTLLRDTVAEMRRVKFE